MSRVIQAYSISNRTGFSYYVSAIIILLLIALYSPLSAQTNIFIGGKVREAGTNTYINAAKVVLVKEISQSRIDSTYTNTFGDYNLFFIWTGIPEQENKTDKIYPNPYTKKTSLEVFAPRGGQYTVSVSDMVGKLFLQKQMQLSQGNNTISLVGGNSGLYMITITNRTDWHKYKAFQTSGSDAPFTAELTNTSSDNRKAGSYKSGNTLQDNILSSGDLVRLIYTEASHYPTDTVFNLALSQGINKWMDKVVITYPHQLDGNALSSIQGKLIQDNSQIYIVKSEGDTSWGSTSNGSFSYSWTDGTPITTVQVGGINIPGHMPNEITVNVDDFNSASITFTGLVYDLSQPVLVKNQYIEPVSNAQVAGGDAFVFTDNNGQATVAKSNLETDLNNLPFNNYTLSLTVTKDNIQTLNQTVYSTVGTNPEVILNVIQEYEHWVWGNSTTPDGTMVSAWKDGIAIHTGTVTGTNYETNHVIRTTNTLTIDSLTFEKPYYATFTKDNVVLVDNGNKEEATLVPLQFPYTFTTTIFPFLESGEPVTVLKPNFSITLQWPDGTTNNYPVDGNGQIVISKVLYKEINAPLGTALLNNDTTDYNNNGVLGWVIIRHPQQKTNRANIAQTESTQLVPEYTTAFPLDSLDSKTIYEYTVRKKAESQTGVWYRLDEQPASGFIGSSGDSKTSGFIEIPSSVAPYLDIIQFGWNITTGANIQQLDLNRSDVITQQNITICYLPNGDTLLPPHRMYTVASSSDPRYQALAARNWDNSVMNYFYLGTPAVAREWIGTYTYNGEPRIWRTTAMYNVNASNGQLFEEKYSAIYGIEEGSGGGLAPFIYTTTNQPTDLGKAMARVARLLDLGTD